MTIALASIGGVLAVALAVVAYRLVQARREHARELDDHSRQLAEAAAVRDALQSQLDATRAAAEELERRLRKGQGEVETAELLRLQREWRELAGPEARLPVAWDASLACAVGSELEIIREVVGTPGTVEIDGEEPAAGAFRLALGVEFLRAAAMDADEMQVRVGDCLVVEGSSGEASEGTASTPHLDSIKGPMAAAGAEVRIEPSEGGFSATLRFGD